MLTWARGQVYSTFILLLVAAPAAAQTLRVSTFNIKWYGLGGYYDGQSSDEYRDRQLRETLERELEDSDVIVFQEIVDVARLKRYVVRGKQKCLTYYNNSSRHQHVVICYKNKYRFVTADGDNNYTIEEVLEGTKKGRPALYGVLKTLSGKSLAYIIGVHLKAFPEETALRLRQTRAIARRIREFRQDIPVIITGDFNTHYAHKTNWSKNDNRLMDDIFKKYNLKLRELYNPFRYSYVSSSGKNKFDRFWVSNHVGIAKGFRVSELCVSPNNLSYKQIDWLNEYVSDHCLISVTLDLN